jgi:hypothetical protein
LTRGRNLAHWYDFKRVKTSRGCRWRQLNSRLKHLFQYRCNIYYIKTNDNGARSEVCPVLLGLVIGLSAALTVSRFLNNILFAVSPTDPLTYAGAAAVLPGVNAAAVYVPARRAGLIDPVQLLRQ